LKWETYQAELAGKEDLPPEEIETGRMIPMVRKRRKRKSDLSHVQPIVKAAAAVERVLLD
jgi:hypothetical protein